MLWLYLALIAYFINAFVFIIDKHLLSGHIPKHNAYAFGVAVLSSFAVLLIPFGVSWQSGSYTLVAFLSGIASFIGLMFLYKAVKESDISVASTQVGTVSAVSTYLFSIAILKDTLPLFNLAAFIFLIAGLLLLGKVAKHILLSAIFAGILFGLSYVFLKLSFNAGDFINGLFWTRMGFAGSAFASLLVPQMRREVRLSYAGAPKSSKFLFVFNKLTAAAGFIVLYFAIRLGNVSLVNALLGLQFMFVFLLALTLKNNISGIGERLNKEVLLYKLAGMGCVLIGLVLLFK